MSCLQYQYKTPEETEKYKINCDNKIFPSLYDINSFNSKELYEFIDEQYSSRAFPEDSPFEFKEDYIKLTNEQICKLPTSFLTPQQKFAGQIMGPASNFKNLLIYHGLGSGKSCTSIVIGEALKNSKNKKLIFVVPAPLVEQYYEEIIGEARGGAFFSCPSFCLRNGKKTVYVNRTQIANLESLKKEVANLLLEVTSLEEQIKETKELDKKRSLERQFKEKQNEYKTRLGVLNAFKNDIKAPIVRTFDIISHQMFINSLPLPYDGDSALFIDNGLLIIDEIQRLVSASGAYYRKLYDAIKYYFHPGLRIALLTATPIYDNPYELALTINLLRPRIPFPLNEKDFYNMFIGEFDEEGNCVKNETGKTWVSQNSCIMNKDLISYICSGYVSYFKGGNPNAYPYKRTIKLEHSFSPTHKEFYINALLSDAKKSQATKVEAGFERFENILLEISDSGDEDKVSGIYVTTQQYSNIALPQTGDEINKTIDQKKRALEVFKTDLRSKGKISPSSMLKYVEKYSKKFAKIIELSMLSDGPVFIFSNWLTYGVEPLAAILEACGYKPFTENDLKPGVSRFFIWSSETTKDKNGGELVKKARTIFNSANNSDGKLLKIILGTRSVMEGVSFKQVKQVHITDPWWNESRISQIIARASRYCSHSSLETENQYVDVFRHFSVFPGFGDVDPDASEILRENQIENWKSLSSVSIDQKMTISSLKKYAINVELEYLLKNCSIDVNINKFGNIIRLEENIVPLQNGEYNVHFFDQSENKIYKRIDIPDSVPLNDILSRKYSYPKKDFPIQFEETGLSTEGYLPYPDPKILQEPTINSDLNMIEQLVPWNTDKTFENLDIDSSIKDYFLELVRKYELIPRIRKKYFKEKGDTVLTFDTSVDSSPELIRCLFEIAGKSDTPESLRKKIISNFKMNQEKEKINADVNKLIYDYKAFDESMLDDLLLVAANDPKVISSFIKTFETK